MRERKEIFLGMRFSKEEMERIDSIRKVLKLNKSEMIRLIFMEVVVGVWLL